MAALYLLTADCMLWNSVQFAILTNVICFEEIRLCGFKEDAVYCFAPQKTCILVQIV